MKVEDTYEAAFYMLRGSWVTAIEFGKVQPSKATKLGYTRKYIIHLDHVNPEDVRDWRDHNATVNVRAYANMRKSLKIKIDVVKKKKDYEMNLGSGKKHYPR